MHVECINFASLKKYYLYFKHTHFNEKTGKYNILDCTNFFLAFCFSSSYFHCIIQNGDRQEQVGYV